MNTRPISSPAENKDGQKILLDLIDSPVEVKSIDIGSFQINYIKAGAGPDLLLLHGANLGWGQWYPNISDLAKHFSIHALDLPGAGHSTKIDFSSCDPEKDFVNTVGNFIQSLGLREVSVVGHSLGGWIAMKLALKKYSVNKLVLVDPMGFTDYIPVFYRLLSSYALTHLLTKTLIRPTPKDIKRFLSQPMVDKSGLKKELVEYVCESIKNQNHPLWLLRRLLILFKKNILLTDQLKNIIQPTLIISGDRDPLIPLKKIMDTASLFPNASVEIFSNTGHVPSLEKSEKFNRIVADFLKH